MGPKKKGTAFMKRQIFNRSPFGYAALGCCAVIAISAAVPAIAASWDKKTVLTVNQPIQVRDTVLEPGQYVFKLLNSNSDRHIVQIFNADESHIIATELAIPNYRLQPTGHSRFSFWETPPGNAKALRAWFYPGDNFGQEFAYPKHLTQIASNEPMPAFTPRLESAPAPSPAVEPEPTPAPSQPETLAAPPEPAPAPSEPAYQAPADSGATTPEPAPAPSAPAQLPHTASPFPLIGLSGLASLGLFAVLRIKRVTS
jgi:hypothetical protein